MPAGAVEITAADARTMAETEYGFGCFKPDGKGGVVVDAAAEAAFILAKSKAAKIAEIIAARDAACDADVTAHARQWQADKHSQLLLGQAISLASAGLPLPPVWRDAANAEMPIVSIADLLTIAGAIAAQTQAAYSKSWALKAQVNDKLTDTVAKVKAIAW